MKILIVGAGGVGGCLAGCLCRHGGAEVSIVARGAHRDAIIKNGLTIIDDGTPYTVHPALCTEDPKDAGIQDAIFFCTKSYGLLDALLKVRPCVGENTLLIPLLNGISARRIISEELNRGIALNGCIYIFSRIEAPGVIEKAGSLCRIVFGSEEGKAPQAAYDLCALLNESGVQAEISDDIRQVMWMKWLLMVSNAMAASYYNISVGELRDDPEKFKLVYELLDEALAVAAAEKVNLPADVKEQVIKTVMSLVYEGRPSLARDLYTPGKPTELSVFSGELCRLADLHGIAAPKSHMIVERFRDRL